MGEGSSISEFEEALASEQYVLSDTDPMQPGLSKWYSEGIYHARNFQELDDTALDNMSKHIAAVSQLFALPHIHVTTKIYGEQMIFQGILRDKMADLNRPGKLGQEHRKSRHKKYDLLREQRRYASDELRFDYVSTNDRLREQKKQALDELCFNYVSFCRLARGTVFRPADGKVLSRFEDLVMDVAAKCHSKHDFSSSYGSLPKKRRDSHADEQLVAAALYRTVFEEVPSAILSPDSDMPRIMEDTCMCIQAENPDFSKLLGRFPINVYFVLPGDERPVKFKVRKFDDSYFCGK